MRLRDCQRFVVSEHKATLSLDMQKAVRLTSLARSLPHYTGTLCVARQRTMLLMTARSMYVVSSVPVADRREPCCGSLAVFSLYTTQHVA